MYKGRLYERVRVCPRCKERFTVGKSSRVCICKECVKKQNKKLHLFKRTCEHCSEDFWTSSKSRTCPDCQIITPMFKAFTRRGLELLYEAERARRELEAPLRIAGASFGGGGDSYAENLDK